MVFSTSYVDFHWFYNKSYLLAICEGQKKKTSSPLNNILVAFICLAFVSEITTYLCL